MNVAYQIAGEGQKTCSFIPMEAPRGPDSRKPLHRAGVRGAPVGAIRAARRLQQDAQDLDLQVRADLHIGEVRDEGGLSRGIAVHVAARVMSEAQGGEILVSETAHGVVAGANLSLSDRGSRELKGIEGQRRLLAVTVGSEGR